MFDYAIECDRDGAYWAVKYENGEVHSTLSVTKWDAEEADESHVAAMFGDDISHVVYVNTDENISW